MLTREEDIDAHALRKQGWTISAIARHLDRDRKTIRAYLAGDRVAGVRKPAGTDSFEPYLVYVTERLGEDPHLWAVTLYDEVVDLGYDKAYSTFTRQVRDRGLRPHCEPCAGVAGRPAAVIEHPPGEETQWDWLELPDPPAAWGWRGTSAHLLVGALAHSSRWRGVLAESEDQAHLIAGLDAVSRRLGGLTKSWRFDRMTTVCHPATGRVTASFAGVAKHYGVSVKVCPPRRGNRKGVVEKANHTAAQRWWRTLSDDVTVEQAQALLDQWCARRGDARLRPSTVDRRASVLTIAEREPLRPVPTSPYPATLTVERTVSAQALVAWRGNFYSVPPELARAVVTVITRLDDRHVDIAITTGAGGVVIARHEAAPDGAGVTVRDHGHVVALEQLVLASHDTRAPHRRKVRIPPGPAARAAADRLRHERPHEPSQPHADEVVIDLSTYDRAATGRNTLT